MNKVSVDIFKYPEIESLCAPIGVGGKNRLYEKVHDVSFGRDLRETGERETEKGTNINSGNNEADNSRALPRKKVSLDYIAGFYDGEGSVSLIIHRMPSAMFGYQFMPSIAISQKDPTILQKISQTLQIGRIYQPFKCRQAYLSIRNKADCARFIKIFKNRVNLKRQQLQLLEKAIKILRKPCGFSHVNYDKPYTKEECLILLDIVEKIRELNGFKQHGIDTNEVRTKIINFNEQAHQRKLDEAKKRRIEALHRYRNVKTHAFWRALLSALENSPQRYKDLQAVAKRAGFSETSVKRILRSLKSQHFVCKQRRLGPYQITEDGMAWLRATKTEAGL